MLNWRKVSPSTPKPYQMYQNWWFEYTKIRTQIKIYIFSNILWRVDLWVVTVVIVQFLFLKQFDVYFRIFSRNFLQHCYSFLHYFYNLYKILQFSPEMLVRNFFRQKHCFLSYSAWSYMAYFLVICVESIARPGHISFGTQFPTPHGILVKKGTSEKQKKSWNLPKELLFSCL